MESSNWISAVDQIYDRLRFTERRLSPRAEQSQDVEDVAPLLPVAKMNI